MNLRLKYAGRNFFLLLLFLSLVSCTSNRFLHLIAQKKFLKIFLMCTEMAVKEIVVDAAATFESFESIRINMMRIRILDFMMIRIRVSKIIWINPELDWGGNHEEERKKLLEPTF